MKNNFRVILAKKRLKISKVSIETGIARSTLIPFYYERDVNPTTKTLLRIADYLGVTLDELLTPEE
ncbi:helix-turn-helix domain-containing protein [Streptococcus sp. CL6.22]|jgi:transcriptional regulator, XRE family|uniref:helix-turn-helix domain-containing protein n=1 Tax=Streptococcus sp. CL6.22 TaxID=3392239 RepID=UPI003C7BC11F